MRLIDADALYEFIQDQMEKETGAYTRGKNKAFNIVKSALHNECATPNIEAEPIVRCKDCEKAIQYLALSETVLCRKYMEYVPMKHYCGFGARRSEQ